MKWSQFGGGVLFVGNDIDFVNDKIAIIDASASPAAQNRIITIAEFLLGLGFGEGFPLPGFALRARGDVPNIDVAVFPKGEANFMVWPGSGIKWSVALGSSSPADSTAVHKMLYFHSTAGGGIAVVGDPDMPGAFDIRFSAANEVGDINRTVARLYGVANGANWPALKEAIAGGAVEVLAEGGDSDVPIHARPKGIAPFVSLNDFQCRGGLHALREVSSGMVLLDTDANLGLLHPVTDNNAREWQVPSNAEVAFRKGTTFMLVNLINVITLTISGTDTLIKAGVGGVASINIGASGYAWLHKLTDTSWLVDGVSLT